MRKLANNTSYLANMINIHPTLVLFEKAYCIDGIIVLVYTITDRNIAYLVSLYQATC